MKTEAEVRAFLASHPGATIDDVRAWARGDGASRTPARPRTPLFGLDALRTIGEQGALMGWGDEIVGAVRGALTPGLSVADAIEQERAGIRRYREDHPVAAVAGELAGALLPAAAASAFTGGAAAPATFGQVAPKLGLAAKIGRAALTGAKFGAVAGAGSADGGLADRLTGAVVGGVAGGVVGGVGPLARRLGETIADVAPGLRAQTAAELAPRAAPTFYANPIGAAVKGAAQSVTLPTSARAAQLVLRSLGRQGSSLADVQAEALAAGDSPFMLLDTGAQQGKKFNLLKLARAAESIPSRGSDEIRGKLGARAQDQGARLGQKLQEAVGLARENVPMTLDILERQMQEEARPLYERAFAHGAVRTPLPEGFLELPFVADAWREALKTAALEGHKLPEVFQVVQVPSGLVDEAGRPLMREALRQVQVPDVKTLHYLKLGLDNIAELQRGKTGGLSSTNEALLVQRTKQLVDLLDKEVPHYRTARETYAGRAAIRDAMEAGRQFLNQPVDQLEYQLSTMTPSERTAFRRGALSAVMEELGRGADDMGRTSDQTAKLAGSPNARRRLRALFPEGQEGDREFAQFLEDARQEAAYAGAHRFVAGGSPTARIQAEQADLANDLTPAAQLAMGNARGALSGAVTSGFRRLGKHVTERNVDAMAPLLTSGFNGREELLQTLAALRQFVEEEGRREARRQLVRRAVTAATGGFTGRTLR